MSVGRAFEDALGASQDYSELREHVETIPIVPGMTPARENRAGALWIDQFELTPPARESARPRIQGIKVDRRDRLLLAPASVAERAIRVGTVIALLIATVLGLWWIGGSGWLRSPSPSSSSLPAPTTAVSDDVSLPEREIVFRSAALPTSRRLNQARRFSRQLTASPRLALPQQARSLRPPGVPKRIHRRGRH